MHHFVKGRGHRHFLGGDRGAALVGALKEAGVAHHLARDVVGIGSQPHPKLGVPRKGTGETGDGGRHPLVATDHLFNVGLLRGEEPAESRG